MKKIKVVGIDASLRNFGFAFADIDPIDLSVDVTETWLVSTEADKRNQKKVRKNSDDLVRCRILREGLEAATGGVSFAFVEMPVGSQSARAMASYGMCIGILASCETSLIQVTPTEVKLAGAGIKTATKEEMIEWATSTWPNVDWPRSAAKCEHVADAAAAIVAGVKTDEFQALMKLARLMKPEHRAELFEPVKHTHG